MTEPTVKEIAERARREMANELDRGRSNPIVTPSLNHIPLTLAPPEWKP